MPQFNKRGSRIRASDKSLVFRFSAGSLLLLFLIVFMLLNLKTIITTDWKAITFSRWQRPFFGHTIWDSYGHSISSGMCCCCYAIPQIPV